MLGAICKQNCSLSLSRSFSLSLSFLCVCVCVCIICIYVDGWLGGWIDGWMGSWLCGLHFSSGTYRPALLTSTPLFLSSRLWAFLQDLGCCSWWPHLSYFWPLPLYFAASASAVKVMTTRYPPRGSAMLEHIPASGKCGSPPTLPTVPPSLNIFLALCAPLSFTVSG